MGATRFWAPAVWLYFKPLWWGYGCWDRSPLRASLILEWTSSHEALRRARTEKVGAHNYALDFPSECPLFPPRVLLSLFIFLCGFWVPFSFFRWGDPVFCLFETKTIWPSLKTFHFTSYSDYLFTGFPHCTRLWTTCFVSLCLPTMYGRISVSSFY